MAARTKTASARRFDGGSSVRQIVLEQRSALGVGAGAWRAIEPLDAAQCLYDRDRGGTASTMHQKLPRRPPRSSSALMESSCMPFLVGQRQPIRLPRLLQTTVAVRLDQRTLSSGLGPGAPGAAGTFGGCRQFSGHIELAPCGPVGHFLSGWADATRRAAGRSADATGRLVQSGVGSGDESAAQPIRNDRLGYASPSITSARRKRSRLARVQRSARRGLR